MAYTVFKLANLNPAKNPAGFSDKNTGKSGYPSLSNDFGFNEANLSPSSPHSDSLEGDTLGLLFGETTNDSQTPQVDSVETPQVDSMEFSESFFESQAGMNTFKTTLIKENSTTNHTQNSTSDHAPSTTTNQSIVPFVVLLAFLFLTTMAIVVAGITWCVRARKTKKAAIKGKSLSSSKGDFYRSAPVDFFEKTEVVLPKKSVVPFLPVVTRRHPVIKSHQLSSVRLIKPGFETTEP